MCVLLPVISVDHSDHYQGPDIPKWLIRLMCKALGLHTTIPLKLFLCCM